jgi:hypothetical protein
MCLGRKECILRLKMYTQHRIHSLQVPWCQPASWKSLDILCKDLLRIPLQQLNKCQQDIYCSSGVYLRRKSKNMYLLRSECMCLRIERLLYWNIYRADNLCMLARLLYQSIYLQDTECSNWLYWRRKLKNMYLLHRKCMCLWAQCLVEWHIYLVDN